MSVFNNLEVVSDFYGVTTQKGDIICNDGTKNARLPVGTDNYVLTADSSTLTGLKWAQVTGNSGNNIAYTQLNLTTLPISTNSTTPISFSQFETTPDNGNYVILYNLSFSMTRITNRSVTFGLYKDNTLINNSVVTVQAFDTNKKNLFTSQFVTSYNGSEVFKVKFNSSNTDTTVSISAGNVILLKISNANQYISTSTFSTNSTTPVIISALSNTPQNGIQLLLFNAAVDLNKNNRSITIGLYKNGILINGASRILDLIPNKRFILQINSVDSFTGTDVITVRGNSSNSDTDINIYSMNLIVVPL